MTISNSTPALAPLHSPRAAQRSLSANPLGRYRDAIFFASGFAGLIYESIWTHYLKLFLGHAAYAQTLVLAIFMGGMAIGAAVAARYTTRIGRPLLIYAAIEAAIGVLAIVFHPIFVRATDGFYDVAFTRHLDGNAFVAIKWGLSALLILPQSILLGATFPVFASAATRSAPNAEGRPIATLYFANSIGGAVGVLMSGFVLIPSVGLAGTIGIAGAVNFGIAALVMMMTKIASRRSATVTEVAKAPAAQVAPSTAATGTRSRFGSIEQLLIAVSLLTGASSFIYEIGWIRMLSLVLGSATHSFELMLSSFIMGLALGGLWIRSRVDTAANPGILLGYVQIVMGCAALATVPLHNGTFNLVAWVVTQAPKTDGGYMFFNLARYGVASLIMFPAAFCAGMTLPLVTRLLYSRQGQGEKAIGLVYSANTVGAIIGLGFAVHVGLPVIGLNYLVASGAIIDALLGAALLATFGGRRNVAHAIIAVVGCVAGTAAAAMTFDPQKMASGVFRTGKAGTDGTVLQIAHGKTATISIEKAGNFLTIKTNGKPDASANPDPTSAYAPDEVTMTLSGAIPLLLHDAPRRVANIGFGSGITGETVLRDSRVTHLDTIEIEPKMIEVAQHFGVLNRNVYTDPRSAIHIDDAKSFFAANGGTYDVIISEPSNPWVSGVAGLFSVEFYRQVTRYLNDGGLFAQWLQVYETNPDRVASVLKAMDTVFDDYLVIGLDYGDILLIGKAHGKIEVPKDGYARMPAAIRTTMRQVEVANQSDILFRIIGNKALWRPWLNARDVPANSDYFPYLDSHADRDRFLGRRWPDIYNIAMSAYPISEVLGGRPPLPSAPSITINGHFGPEPPWLAARQVKEILFGPAHDPESVPIPARMPPNLARQGQEILDLCDDPPPSDSPLAITKLSNRVLPYLSPADGRATLWALDGARCFKDLFGTQTQWRALLPPIADRNPKGFGDVAAGLLDNAQGSSELRTRYLLGMAMLGNVGAGDAARALALWEQYSKQAFGDKPPDLAFELILAHARSAQTQR